MFQRKILGSFVGLSFLVTGCASATPGQRGALMGSAAGAGLGAIIGHQVGRHTAEGALIGAAAGGIGGALIGEKAATKFCPTCGRSFFSDQTYCPFDGTLLVTKGSTAQPAPKYEAPAAQSVPQTIIVNVPNRNGSFTPVTLRVAGDGTYIGPRGEVYTSQPTVDQLKTMYGK